MQRFGFLLFKGFAFFISIVTLFFLLPAAVGNLFVKLYKNTGAIFTYTLFYVIIFYLPFIVSLVFQAVIQPKDYNDVFKKGILQFKMIFGGLLVIVAAFSHIGSDNYVTFFLNRVQFGAIVYITFCILLEIDIRRNAI
jgi:hypothetical protein